MIVGNSPLAPKPTLSPVPAGPAKPAVASVPTATVPGDAVTLSEQSGADGGRAVRVGQFIQSAKASAAENLGYLSSVWAGQLVGACVGAVIGTPLALSFGNMYIMTGGAALTGGLGALAGYYIEKHRQEQPSDDRKLKIGPHEGLVAAGTAMRWMKKIAYPTVINASEAEKQAVYRALDSLPLSGVTSVSTIDLVHGLEKQGIAGVAHPIGSQSRILLDKEQMAIPHWNEEVAVHEVGHTFDFTRGFGPIGSRSMLGGGFGKDPFISQYAHTNRMEDYAESYLNYHRHPERLQAAAPEKFAALETANRRGLSDFVLDRQEVRGAGKTIGQALGSVPYLRTGLELALSLIAPLQVNRGAHQLQEGLAANDDQQKLDGKMNLAKGAFLVLPGAAPLALASSLTHMVLNRQVQNQTLTAAEASQVASKVLTVATGPVGMIGAAAGSELRKAGVNLDQPARSQAFEKGTFATGLLATVGGAAAGGFLGSTLGTALGGLPGALAGFAMGQLGGAALGLGAFGAVHSLRAQEETRQGPNDLTGADKWFLGKVVGGAVVGGVAGSVAGGHLGRLAGEALGAAVAGPVGAVTGGLLGRTAGVMAGSLALAKAGAALGRTLSPEETAQQAA